MADFTASNNYRVRVNDFGFVRVYDPKGNNAISEFDHLGADEVEALREFFAYQDTQKPHHLAQVGEVWDLDSTQGQAYRVMAVTDDDEEEPMFITSAGEYYNLTDPVFTGGVKVA